MTNLVQDLERQIVPRLRDFSGSLGQGELAPLRRRERVESSSDALNQLVEDWRDSHNLSIAADLVSSAYILGMGDVAAEAAESILSDLGAPPSARSIAALYLGREDVVVPGGPGDIAPAGEDRLVSEPDWAILRRFQIEIHRVRGLLADYPRNPLLWHDLARLYTTVNSQAKATRAMQVALDLAKHNRLILRGASRLFLHQGEGERAHQLLASSPIVRLDPWVLAAEIATASAIRRPTKNVKWAQRVLEAGRQSPFHLCELASAVGTLEARAGRIRAGRKFVERSLRAPTENAVAQASWLVRNVGLSVNLNLASSNEAIAWSSWMHSQWSDALLATHRWQEEQPFSSRPALLGSHLAGVLEDHAQAVEIARLGLLSNEREFILQNNLAFSLISAGRAKEGAAILTKIGSWATRPDHLILRNATTGLFWYRSGVPDIGKAHYEEAIRAAASHKGSAAYQKSLERLEILARIYLALEESRIGTAASADLRSAALKAAETFPEPWVEILIKRIRSYSLGNGSLVETPAQTPSNPIIR